MIKGYFLSREAWRDAGEDEKTQKVLRAIERLLGEGESQVENLEDIKREILMKNALEWKKFKMLVALSCSSMVGPDLCRIHIDL